MERPLYEKGVEEEEEEEEEEEGEDVRTTKKGSNFKGTMTDDEMLKLLSAAQHDLHSIKHGAVNTKTNSSNNTMESCPIHQRSGPDISIMFWALPLVAGFLTILPSSKFTSLVLSLIPVVMSCITLAIMFRNRSDLQVLRGETAALSERLLKVGESMVRDEISTKRYHEKVLEEQMAYDLLCRSLAVEVRDLKDVIDVLMQQQPRHAKELRQFVSDHENILQKARQRQSEYDGIVVTGQRRLDATHAQCQVIRRSCVTIHQSLESVLDQAKASADALAQRWDESSAIGDRFREQFSAAKSLYRSIEQCQSAAEKAKSEAVRAAQEAKTRVQQIQSARARLAELFSEIELVKTNVVTVEGCIQTIKACEFKHWNIRKIVEKALASAKLTESASATIAAKQRAVQHHLDEISRKQTSMELDVKKVAFDSRATAAARQTCEADAWTIASQSIAAGDAKRELEQMMIETQQITDDLSRVFADVKTNQKAATAAHNDLLYGRKKVKEVLESLQVTQREASILMATTNVEAADWAEDMKMQKEEIKRLLAGFKLATTNIQDHEEEVKVLVCRAKSEANVLDP